MTIERNREEILGIAARHGARNVACLVQSREAKTGSIATLICMR
jgi:hypothetical protein